jgi:2-octaprenyl-6-methoxyphenol hydroxylase
LTQPTNDAAADLVDVAIVGGGLVGASLALALCGGALRVALVEGFAPGAPGQPSFDDRTTALGNGTRAMLATLDVWPLIAAEAAPIDEIQVTDAGRFGMARLRATEQGLDALGHVVTNRTLGAALWQRLSARHDLMRFMPARAAWLSADDQAATLKVAPANGEALALRARLVVAADGADSALRQALGLGAQAVDYEQVAVVANVATSEPHGGVAHERFTPQGPIALLPLFDGGRGLIWTLPPPAAQRVMALTDSEFLAELQQAFGWRAGRFSRAGKRASYPLVLQRADATEAARCVLVGNAAQALHPIAGQGFNLGMRDAALLAETLLANSGDCGAAEVLQTFGAARSADRRGVIGFTDRLVRLFGDSRPGIGTARNLGLILFDLLPPAKDALSRLSWGWDGRRPRLSRGLPLR